MKKIRQSNKHGGIIVAVIAFCCITLLPQNFCAADEAATTAQTVAAGLPAMLEKLPLEFVPKVGKWVRYKLTERGSGAGRDVTIGVDKVADINQRVGYWIEISTASSQGVPVHLRFLYDPQATDNRRIRRFIVKADQHPAVEIDARGHKYMLFDSKLSGVWHKPVNEKIATPAGTFDTRRARFVTDKNEALEIWMSENIPLTGLVRVTSINQDFELQEYGGGYQSVVSEPVRFKLPGGGKSLNDGKTVKD